MPKDCLKCGSTVPDHSPGKLCPRCLLAGADSMESGESTVAQDTTNQIPAERFAPGTVLADRYRILTLIGRGGMGEVYRADDLKLKHPVALKFLPPALTADPKLLDSLYNEVRQARRVSHRHVCRVHDVGETDGQPFLSMELVEGDDLGALLRQIGRLPGSKGLELARQLCAGLAAAHDEGLLHLDLKPGNLLIDRRGNLRITDFGLARLAAETKDSTRRAGTPAYMAPEQILGKPLSPRSDLYAVGLILFEMFSGQRLHADRNPQEILNWHRTASSPEAPSSITPNFDPELEKLILSCLRDDPEKRPRTADEILAALDSLGDDQSSRYSSQKQTLPKSGKQLAVLMFTDIVGSVAQQQSLGTEAYTTFVSRHDAIIKSALAKTRDAQVLNETGDGFLVRFSDPSDAVNTALELQYQLSRDSGDHPPIQIRIGLNMGVVTEMEESNRGAKRAVGMPINIAARVMDLAGAGQILMTRAVYDDARHYVRDHPPVPGSPGHDLPSVAWLAHGAYQIKGSDQLIEIFEVGAEGTAPLRPPENSDKATRAAHATQPSSNPATGNTQHDPVTVDDLRHGDVFINYAQIDDRALTAGDEGWISRFHHNLEVRMEQLSGRQVKILRPQKSDPSQELDDLLLETLPEVKTMVSVLSPPLVHSPGCIREIQSFWNAGDPAARSHVSGKPRLFKAVKTPVDLHQIPPPVDSVLSGLLAFDFFEVDPASGRIREFSESQGTTSEQRFHERVYDLAQEINGVLNIIGSGQADASQPTRTPGGKTVFLATTTSDVEPDRDRLRRELVARGHTVLPESPLPLVAADLESTLTGLLGRCDFAIHLIGHNYGIVPEGGELSLVETQNRLAARHSCTHGLARIIWMPKGLAPDDPRQSSLIEAVRNDPDTHTSAEIVVGSIENLKALAVDSLNPKPKPALAAPDSAESQFGERPPRVYLICEPGDEQAIEPLEDALFEQGFDVSLPDFEADETEAAENHRQNLRDCDAVIIFYGSARSAWVDIKIRNTIKAGGYGRKRGLAATAVYVAPPFDRRKERFRSHSAHVIRQQSDTFDPSSLEPFTTQAKTTSTSES